MSLAALFIALGAEFMGLIQIIVYAGAVMVLFLFVMSLLGRAGRADGAAVSLLPGQEKPGRRGGGCSGVRLLIAAAAARLTRRLGGVHAGYGAVRAFGAALFYEHVLVLQLAALLLMVAVVGVVVLIARRADRRGVDGRGPRHGPAGQGRWRDSRFGIEGYVSSAVLFVWAGGRARAQEPPGDARCPSS